VGKILAALLVLVAVVLGLGDQGARLYAQRQIAKRIDTNVASAHAKVAISSFPFLGRLATSATVPKIRARVAKASSGRFTFDSIEVTLTGVRLNRSVLWKDRRVQLQRIDRGTVTADMTETAVRHALGDLPVTLGNGTAQLTIQGFAVTARVSISDNQLHLEATGAPLSVPIPKLPLLPCAAAATVTTGHLHLSCSIHDVPAALLQAAGPAST
jgi:hypothetical protein